MTGVQTCALPISLDCRGELRRFLPAGLPGLYTVNEDSRFLRQVETAQEMNSFFSDALGSLLSGQGGAPLSTLYLNLNNPLVRRLYCLPEGELLEDALRILYVQALLAGGHPLRGGELKLMNQSLLGLVEEAAGRGKTP